MGRHRRNDDFPATAESHLVQRLTYPLTTSHGNVPLQRIVRTATRLHQILSGDLPAQRLNLDRTIFLDTETTGLGEPGTYIFLVGLGFVTKSHLVVQQHFMRSLAEERAMLAHVRDILAQAETVVTFNGLSFDLPLLHSRWNAHGIVGPAETFWHLDLLPPARRVWRAFLPNCRLSTLEQEILRVHRADDVPSAAIPERYLAYLHHGNLDDLTPVFSHNVVDILSLVALLIVLNELS